MKMICPSCNAVVSPEHVNKKTDLVFCAQCSEVFMFSENVDQDFVNAGALQNPPANTWFKRDADKVVVGASMGSRFSFVLLIAVLAFSLVHLGVTFWTPSVAAEFNPMESLSDILLILVQVFFLTILVMKSFGRVEVTIAEVSSVFTGIGPLGWRRVFDRTEVKSIREKEIFMDQVNSGFGSHIVMAGNQGLGFGGILNKKKKHFILNALKLVKAERFSRFR